MISKNIEDTVFALSNHASAGTLTRHQLARGFEVLLDLAAQVRALEDSRIPTDFRLTDDDIAGGKVVRLSDRRRA